MTPADLIAARDLLDRPGLASVGGWPRAVALLTRQALEKGLEEFWAASPATAGLRSCSKKSQLTCLPMYLNRGISRQISYVWAALSSDAQVRIYDSVKREFCGEQATPGAASADDPVTAP